MQVVDEVTFRDRVTEWLKQVSLYEIVSMSVQEQDGLLRSREASDSATRLVELGAIIHRAQALMEEMADKEVGQHPEWIAAKAVQGARIPYNANLLQEEFEEAVRIIMETSQLGGLELLMGQQGLLVLLADED